MTTFALPVEALAAVHGCDIETMLTALERAERQGLLERDDRGRWTATARARQLHRDVLLDLDVDDLDTEKT